MMSPGLPHDGNTLRERSLGGSETAAIHICAALARRGHRVVAFAPGNAEPKVIDGVRWMSIDQAAPYMTSTAHDVTIISRAVDMLRFRIASKLRILWCHDLAHKRARGLLGGTAWNLDRLYVMSDFQKRQYASVHEGVPGEYFFVTKNGVALAELEAMRKFPRDRNRIVYGSRPERGLETALGIMECLGRMGSPLRLEVAWYDHTVPEMQPYYEALWNRAKQMPNVKLLGPLKQHDWATVLAQSLCLIYPGQPGEFREISCIAAIEAQAVGTPVVSCAKGAICETLGFVWNAETKAWESPHPVGGILVGDEDSNPHLRAFQEEFAGALEALRRDEVTSGSLARRGRQRIDESGYAWDDIARAWQNDWEQHLSPQSDDPWRVRRHFERIGDREMLAAL